MAAENLLALQRGSEYKEASNGLTRGNLLRIIATAYAMIGAIVPGMILPGTASARSDPVTATWAATAVTALSPEQARARALGRVEQQAIGQPGEEQRAAVHIAQPVGRVSVSRAADALGDRTYSSRAQVSGSASLISFSSRPPVTGSLGGWGAGRMPVVNGVLTSRFGMRRHPTLGGFRAHAGVDLAAPAGSPITATADGEVTTAGWSGGYGLLVALDHGGGRQTRYGHMSRLNVAVGQQVRQGDVIGFVGSTGRSTGPHVHYETRVNGRAVDPFSG